MTVEKLFVVVWRIFRSSCAQIIFRAFRKFRRRFITLFAMRWRDSQMPNLELYGTASCPYTSEMREWLEWSGKEFQEFDVESDQQALARMREIAPAPYTVPILVEDGKVVRVGWQGRGCIVAAK